MPGTMAETEDEELEVGLRECASKTQPPRKLNVLASMINVRRLALKNLISMIQSHLAVNVNLPITGNSDNAALLKSVHQRLILLQLLLSLSGLRIGLVQLGLILLFALLILLVTLLILRHQTLQLLDLLLLLDLHLADNIARINIGRSTWSRHIRGLHSIRVGKGHTADCEDSQPNAQCDEYSGDKSCQLFFHMSLSVVLFSG